MAKLLTRPCRSNVYSYPLPSGSCHGLYDLTFFGEGKYPDEKQRHETMMKATVAIRAGIAIWDIGWDRISVGKQDQSVDKDQFDAQHE
ncbi:hypothetical protein AUP42_06175 [Thalassospira lucentensis]|uniref:Uncharacterized protein n=1 Tax=Thalassospira lucentensis TaxID=168935 RepID=A0A154L152_9PROT|nr:hypothetical protein [Thalassospira lucentensis]KZB61543.1 hypothetical protein AUP42_06175 [Thalassospira lucentensis]